MFRYFGIAMMSGFLEKIRGTFLKFFTSYPISTLCVSQDNLNFLSLVFCVWCWSCDKFLCSFTAYRARIMKDFVR